MRIGSRLKIVPCVGYVKISDGAVALERLRQAGQADRLGAVQRQGLQCCGFGHSAADVFKTILKCATVQ